MKTWKWEALVAAAVLAATWFAQGQLRLELLGSGAVFLTFMHAQVTDRLQEAEGKRARPEIACYRWERRYFIGKEILWAWYFVLHQAWSPCVGVALLIGYRAWRTHRRLLRSAAAER